MKERNRAIDTISGFFILEIIIQHILQNSGLYEGSFFEKYIIRFFPAFMPWFYFKAGLMYKQPTNTREAIKNRAIKLLYPFAVWSIIPSVLVLPFFIYDGNIYGYIREIAGALYYAHGPFNTPLWFLPSFFFAYLIMYVTNGKHLILLFVSAILAYLFSKAEFKIPLGLVNLPLGVFFFAFGAILKASEVKANIVLIPVFSFIYLFNVIFFENTVSFHRNELLGGTYWGYIIEVSILLFIIFLLLHYRWNIPILSSLGKNSIIMYVSHAPVIILCKKICDFFNLNMETYVQVWLYTVCITIVLIIFMKTKNRMTFLFKLS